MMELTETPLWKFISEINNEKYIIFSNGIKNNFKRIIFKNDKIIIDDSFLLEKEKYVGNLNLDLLIFLQNQNLQYNSNLSGGRLINEFILRYKNKKLILTNKWYKSIEKRTLKNEWVLRDGRLILPALVRKINIQKRDGTWSNPNCNLTFNYSVVLYLENAADNETLEIINLLIQNKLEIENDELKFKIIKNSRWIKNKNY